MKVLVVGQGRAGSRHANVLQGLGCQVDVISRRADPHTFEAFSSGGKALKDYQRVIVATESSNHEDFLSTANLEGFTGRLLIEKPAKLSNTTQNRLAEFDSRVAYNLRYLDSLGRLRRELEGGDTLLRLVGRANSFLPDWRPDTDQRSYYSRHIDLGGGALNDLSHEFDYLSFLVGSWRVLSAVGGRLGNVTDDADDAWEIIGETVSGSTVALSLSTISRIEARDLTVDTNSSSYRVDFLDGTLRSNKECFQGNRIKDTYSQMLADFAFGSNLVLPTTLENQKVLDAIELVRSFSEKGEVLDNE
jgi:predicted dehydrogenase